MTNNAAQPIVINDDIPLPAQRLRGRPSPYPFSTMAVGQSFFTVAASSTAIYKSASYYGKCKGRKFTVRSVTENGVDGVRVWRIK